MPSSGKEPGLASSTRAFLCPEHFERNHDQRGTTLKHVIAHSNVSSALACSLGSDIANTLSAWGGRVRVQRSNGPAVNGSQSSRLNAFGYEMR